MLRVVKGDLTPEELAALVAVVAARNSAAAHAASRTKPPRAHSGATQHAWLVPRTASAPASGAARPSAADRAAAPLSEFSAADWFVVTTTPLATESGSGWFRVVCAPAARLGQALSRARGRPLRRPPPKTTCFQPLIRGSCSLHETPDDCYFGLWDGFGEIEGGDAVGFLTRFAGPAKWPGRIFTKEKPPPPSRPRFRTVLEGPSSSSSTTTTVRRTARLRLASGAQRHTATAIPRDINSPNLMWPATGVVRHHQHRLELDGHRRLRRTHRRTLGRPSARGRPTALRRGGPAMRIVLASALPPGSRCLRSAGIHPDVIVSGVNEDQITTTDAGNLAAALAQLKCRAVAPRSSPTPRDRLRLGAGVRG